MVYWIYVICLQEAEANKLKILLTKVAIPVQHEGAPHMKLPTRKIFKRQFALLELFMNKKCHLVTPSPFATPYTGSHMSMTVLQTSAMLRSAVIAFYIFFL